jgi:hypothetical protein
MHLRARWKAMPHGAGVFMIIEPPKADEISRRKGVLQHTGVKAGL